MKNILTLIVISLTFYSCSKDSDTPVNPEPSNTIFTQSGLIDSIQLNTQGNSSITRNFFSSPYDFTGLDSITVQYTYSKSGSANIPLEFVYLESSMPDTLYSVNDTLTSQHTYTQSKRIVSPKKTVTLGYTIRAFKNLSDTMNATIKLRDVTFLRK